MESSDEYEDATGSLEQHLKEVTSLGDGLNDVNNAINLFFNNQFQEAKTLCRSKSKSSMYHALGESTLLFLEAIMTFESEDIEKALDSIRCAVNLCNGLRKKQNIVSTFGRALGVKDTEIYSGDELHAEVVFAELNLFFAFLTFIQNENFVNVIKGGLKIRLGYKAYKDCQSLLEYENVQQNQFIQHFIGAVNLGCGGFNIGMSLLPPRVISLLKWIGFESDKDQGLKQLTDCYTNINLRSSLSSLFILSYHLFISPFVGCFDTDIEFSREIINKMLQKFPSGVYFHFFAGRLYEFEGKYDKAIEHLNKASSLQNEWRQFSHFCYWELMWCCSYQMKWKEASDYATILCEESNWSKCLYTYLKAIFLYELKPENSDQVEALMRMVPQLKKRIAGKSLPVEKFVVRKARKYLEQGKRLVAPVHEILSMWNQLSMLKNNENFRDLHLKKINEEFNLLEEKRSQLAPNLDHGLLYLLFFFFFNFFFQTFLFISQKVVFFIMMIFACFNI